MRCDFNKIFHPDFQRESIEQLRMKLEKHCFCTFFPDGITTRKRYFTPNELVDIYIKGNDLLYGQLESRGFGDEDFNHSKTEWENAVLSPDKWYAVPQELHEKRNAFVMLVSAYLDIDKNLSSIGHAAFTNAEIISLDSLISKFEQLSLNFNLYLYYRFFAQIERLRQSNYELLRLFECGAFNNNTYAEEKASSLETIKNAKYELKILAQQIEACNKKARELDERTDENGKSKAFDA